jgi:hypothetical protein
MQTGAKLTFIKSHLISLANHPDFDEPWLERLIKDDPGMLQLGNLEIVSSQIPQKRGKLDLLLKDKKNETLYVVELMLGDLDESHIIRGIEYWLRERSRKTHADYDIVCVIAAENVLESRFVDVVRFLSEQMPLVLMQIHALQTEDKITVHVSKIFDGRDLETEAISPALEADRAGWVEASSEESLRAAEEMLNVLKRINPDISLTFKQQYLGLRIGNRASNFIYFNPKRKWVRVYVKTLQAVALADRMRVAGIEVLGTPENSWVVFRLTTSLFSTHLQLLTEIAKLAYDEYNA